MNHFLLLALLSCYVLAAPAEEKPAAKPLDYGAKCDPAKKQCDKELGCYNGVCLFKPSKVGEKCGGVTLTPHLCEQGLRCVYKAKKGEPGECQERTTQNGGRGQHGEDCKNASQCNPGLECAEQRSKDGAKLNLCMPYAMLGEICASKLIKRTCAEGYECISKESHKDTGNSQCYPKGVKTVGLEGDVCEGKTNTICGPGFVCKEEGDQGKICQANQKESDLPKDGDDCDGPDGTKGKCAPGNECIAIKMPEAKDVNKCVKHPTQGEDCNEALGAHACAEGYECLNKAPHQGEGPKKCYMKGIKTIANVHEGCEGETNSKCAPGMSCVDAPSKKSKWCVRDKGIVGKPKEGAEKKDEVKPEEKKEGEEKKEEPKKEGEEKKEEPKKEDAPKAEGKKEEAKPEEKKEEPKKEEEKKEDAPKAEEKKEEPKKDEEKKDE